jgi:hypothetical protein
MHTLEFVFWFHSKASLADRVEAELWAEVERWLRALIDGHADLSY